MLIYDTCESGSLTGDRVSQRGIERVAALEKMTRAMGRTVLTASTDDTPALEGVRGHGVFTYVLLDALGKADANGNGFIEMTELAEHVDQHVPEVSFAEFKFRQVPQMRMVGSSFAVASTTAILDAEPGEKKTPPMTVRTATHVVRDERVVVRGAADANAAEVLVLAEGSQVREIETSGQWSLIAIDGKPVGYVVRRSLLRLQ